MSALQLRALLEHIMNTTLSSVAFAFKGGRLFIRFTDAGGNLFFRSFGTDGSFQEHEEFSIEINNVI